MGILPFTTASSVPPGAVLLQIDVLGTPIPERAFVALGVVVILTLIVLSAFFSSSEIAMFSLASHRLDKLVKDGKPGAELVKQLKDDPHRLLVTILVGNNLVNIAMTSISTGLLALYVSQGQAVAISTFGITALVLLFGESVPKSYAVENTESWALTIARPLKLAEYVLLPLIVFFDYLTRHINQVTGGGSAIETSYVTRDEIQDMIKTGEREGVIEEDEREMLQRIFRFNNTIAKEVMTPRLDVTAIDAESTVEEAIETCVQSGHARIPVYEGSLDNVIGIVNIRDLVRDQNYGASHAPALDDLIQPTLHVPESKNVDDLLREMRADRLRIAIVIDEFGTTEGIVSVEDMIEEIVGEILEGGEDEPIEIVDDDTLIAQGEVNIDAVNDALDIELPEGEEFETIAGFVFNRAGRLVEAGESLDYDGVEITVESVENTRITAARVHRLPDTEASVEATAEADGGPGETD